MHVLAICPILHQSSRVLGSWALASLGPGAQLSGSHSPLSLLPYITISVTQDTRNLALK